jgi:leucyl aminopeptidase
MWWRVPFHGRLIALPFTIMNLPAANSSLDSFPSVQGIRDRIVHVDGLHAVVKNKNFSANLSGNAWYVVNTSKWKEIPAFVRSSGFVADHVPGKFAVMQLDSIAVERLSTDLHREGMACGAIALLSDMPVHTTRIATPIPVKPVETEIKIIHAMAGQIDASRIRTTVEEISRVTTRYHSTPSGVGITDWLMARYRDVANGRSDVEISRFDHDAVSTRQASVVVRIRGTKTPDELLVLGSHIDSVNWNDGTGARSPGSDDNASGTATNLEIFRVLMENRVRFDRTIEIHGYAAEEIGLVGSLHVASEYKKSGKRVIAMMQQDMNLYKEAGQPDKIWFVEENTNPGFNDQLGVLVDRYVKVPWEKGSLTAGSSDHASWTRRGFAAAFPFENPEAYNPHIHTADDDSSHADAFTQSAAFGKLGLAYLAHFAGIN